MKRATLPTPHAEFESLSKLELLRLAEDLLTAEPTVVDYCISFVCAETRGFWHNRARAMLCRRLKHAELGRSQRERLQECILGRLNQGNFSEQFKDQLRLAIKIDPTTAAVACRRGISSPHPHVQRYCAWALSLPAITNAA